MIEINIPAVIKVKLGAGHSVKSHIECDAAGQPLVMYPKPGSIINFDNLIARVREALKDPKHLMDQQPETD
jgi:hypothetical protein